MVKYRIFIVNDYEVVYDQSDAVVSGRTQQDALSLLEDHLLTCNKKMQFTREELAFRVRGKVIDTGINADKREMIYSKWLDKI